MRQAGRISNWNDDKGFGFVMPHDGGSRAFVHIKAFQVSSRRPVEGDLISYDASADAKGRLNASNVRYAGQRILTPAAAPPRKAKSRKGSAHKTRSRKPPMRIPRIAIGASFLLAAIVLMVLGKAPAALSLVYLLMSCASYLMYALDKEVAGKSRWRRTPESTLHMLDVMGGWPGGLIAQQVARHKTAKASFQGVFWFTVVLNVTLYGWLWQTGTWAAMTDMLLG